MRQTLLHLIRAAVEPEAPAVPHWMDEAINFQGDAAFALSPGMRQHLDLERIWRVARNNAGRSLPQHGTTVPPLPETCPLALDTLLDPAFDPDGASRAIAAAMARAG